MKIGWEDEYVELRTRKTEEWPQRYRIDQAVSDTGDEAAKKAIFKMGKAETVSRLVLLRLTGVCWKFRHLMKCTKLMNPKK